MKVTAKEAIDYSSISNINRLINIDWYWLISILIDYRFHRLSTPGVRSADKLVKAHCLPLEWTLKISVPWCILPERNKVILAFIFQRVFVIFVQSTEYILRRGHVEFEGMRAHYTMFFDDPLTLQTNFNPRKTDIQNDTNLVPWAMPVRVKIQVKILANT
jgi:hypothetical protein